jgi:1,4-dihydroxy-2-naphthoyl-CoA synthase
MAGGFLLEMCQCSDGGLVSEFVRVSIDDSSGVATVTLDRPKLNALNRQMQNELRDEFLALGANEKVRAIVMTGNDRAFAAGADVKEMVNWTSADVIREGAELEASFSSIAQTRQPIIAAVTGYALGGGCELALCADLRIAGEGAQFGQPEILLGIIPGAGGTQRLARLIGSSRAKELILTGRTIGSAQALAIGLVNEVVSDDQVLPRALTLATELATRPAVAAQAAKAVIDAGLDTDLASGLELERQAFAQLFATKDRATGMQSFIEAGPGKAVFDHE